MDFSESTREVYSRIRRLDPENASKIMGYLLLQGHAEREMIRLAFGPDNSIQSVINRAKSELGLIPKPQFAPFLPAASRSFSFPSTATRIIRGSETDSLDSGADDHGLESQFGFLSLEDQLESVSSAGSEVWTSYHYPESWLGPRTSRRSPSLPEFPLKACHYFNKGLCRHGSSCRYFHGQVDSVELSGDDHLFLPGSVENLESEIAEILKSRRGFPVSIASLPTMYYEKYGRVLQAQGYLTESQRHGKAGFSLTKLLARLNNRIRLIDRPHGQHSVILAEDLPRYMEYLNEKSDAGGIVAGSRQIYLTFPAESTFSEQDVSDYFSDFGTVQDVRIPWQQKRMFGFVSFVSPETARHILAKGNPHFVCGARVLVKPYREKSRLIDRKYAEKLQHQMHSNAHFLDADFEPHPMLRVCDGSRLPRIQSTEEHERFLEPKLLTSQPYFGYSMDELKPSEAARAEHDAEFLSAKRFNYFLSIFNRGSSTDEDKTVQRNANYSGQGSSHGPDLSENPAASPVRSGIST